MISIKLNPTIKFLSFIFLLITLVNCNIVKPVIVENPFDTNSKKIFYQPKKIYNLETLDIKISNNFDGARLNNVEKINDTLIAVSIYPENAPINNSAYYAFKIWSDTSKNLYVQFKYPKDYEHRYIPKLKTNATDWTPISNDDIFLIDSLYTVKLALTKEPLTVAAQEIITSTDTKKWYSEIISSNPNLVHYKTIGKSVLGKPLPMLDLYIGDPKNKDIIVLLSRQHPPEISGFIAFQSFLETILNGSQLSKIFFSKYRVLVFPIVNPDGVDLGHWRHNANGLDLNRDWGYYRQPEVKAITKAIVKTANKSDGKVVIGIDFHSTQEDIYYTSHTMEGTTIPHFYDEWFGAIDAAFPNYTPNEIREDSTQPVSKGWFLTTFGATAVTYEIGDETPRYFVKEKAKVAAIEMMKILNKR
ncbi:MAG: succinylglutamate desuccinylase/aspartoacylase family protein [Lutibacter sp.]|nr:succinylglutamate desuccinylase/aspartoacylase family protein [Lutibacter sp.]